jgi:hypothetical protein
VEEAAFDESAAADLVAQLTAGATLSFDPDSDDDLLPGTPKADSVFDLAEEAIPEAPAAG